MRDGIYRTLPMPRRWRSVFKMCERESERDRFAAEAAFRAIETDFRQSLGRAFINRLEAEISTAQSKLPLNGENALPPKSDLGGSNTAIERHLYDGAAFLLSTSPKSSPREIIRTALSLTVAHQRDAQLRECTRHAHANGVNGRIAAHALRNALSQINTGDIAQRYIDRAPARRGPLRPQVDLDEAL